MKMINVAIIQGRQFGGGKTHPQRRRATLIGLTGLWIHGRPMASRKINRRRALFVQGKIDEILAWEKTKEQERDTRHVDLRELRLAEKRPTWYIPSFRAQFWRHAAVYYRR